MKKVLLISLLVSVFVLQTYADDSILENVENKSSSKSDFSVISSDFLVHTPLLLNYIQYENLEGKRISYKNVNLKLQSVPENQVLLKEHKIWKGITYALLGICTAGSIAITVVGDQKGPVYEAISEASFIASTISLSSALLTSGVSASKYLKAVDNYNVSLLQK